MSRGSTRAGMELDRTLLVFDWLNGEPLSALERIDRDPIGPSAAAAAFDRAAFLEAGGFDERLFAYWEDVDLVLRLRRAGHGCVLAADAQGVHQHSATLRLGIEPQELPDGLRPRLRAAQVGGADAGQGGLGRAARGDPVRGPARRSTGRRAGSAGACAATRRRAAPSATRRRCSPARAPTGAWSADLGRRARRRGRLRRALAAGGAVADARGLPPRRHQRAVAVAGARAGVARLGGEPRRRAAGGRQRRGRAAGQGDGAAARLRGADDARPRPRRAGRPSCAGWSPRSASSGR